jgi:hypothetical protein
LSLARPKELFASSSTDNRAAGRTAGKLSAPVADRPLWSGDMGDPSVDGAGCGADPKDSRGRSPSRGAGLSYPLLSFSLSLPDTSGLNGFVSSSEELESSTSRSSDIDDFLG